MREYAGGRPSQSSVSPKALPLQACFLLSGLNAQPRLRILAGSASAGGVRFLDGGNLRCFSKVRCLSEASSDFWKTVLADFRHLRSQPPTKPQTGQYPEPRRPFSHQTVQSPTTSRRSPPSQPSSAALMAQQPSNSTKKETAHPCSLLMLLIQFFVRSSRNYPCRQSSYKSQT